MGRGASVSAGAQTEKQHRGRLRFGLDGRSAGEPRREAGLHLGPLLEEDRVHRGVPPRAVGPRAIASHAAEHLRTSDRGIALLRKLLREQLAVVAAGGDPVGVVRDVLREQRITRIQHETRALSERASAFMSVSSLAGWPATMAPTPNPLATASPSTSAPRNCPHWQSGGGL